MKHIKTILIIPFLLIWFNAIARVQTTNIEIYKVEKDAEPGYIITKDNEYKGGFVIIEKVKGNIEYVYFSAYLKGTLVKYNKNNIIELGNRDDVYVLLPYENDSVFMLKINKKEPFLYYYKSNSGKKFFLKKEDDLELLSQIRDELRVRLNNEINGCDAVSDKIKYATYNKNRLSSLYKRIDECSNKKIPFFKFGIFTSAQLHKFKMAGNNYFSMSSNSIQNLYIINLDESDFTPQLTSSYGLFMDIPFMKKNLNLTFHPEFEYSNVNYKYSISDEILNIDISYLNANLFFRYNKLTNKKSLFTDFGVVYSYINVNEINIESGDDIYSSKYSLAQSMVGLGAGIGLDFPVFKRNTLNIGIRGNYLISLEGNPSVWNLAPFLGFTF